MTRRAGQATPRIAAALTLSVAHLRLRPRRAGLRAPGHRSRARGVLAAVLACAGPAAAAQRLAHRGHGQWCPPPSLAGKLLLIGYVASGALSEELIWRAPLTYPATTRCRLSLAGASATGFVAGHLRRDGVASLPEHAVMTVCWTLSALAGRSVAPSVLAHCAYNYVAYSTVEARCR